MDTYKPPPDRTPWIIIAAGAVVMAIYVGVLLYWGP